MSSCVNTRPVVGCFQPNDTTLDAIPIVIHYIYDDKGVAIGQSFTLSDASETPIDPTSYLGGGTVAAGVCNLEKEVVCVDLGDGCNVPAFRVLIGDRESFYTSSGEVTDQVVQWEAGDCMLERAYIDTCFLPDQYAIVWAWNGSGDIMSYDPITGLWTDYGKTTLADGTVIGGFSMDIKNDTVNPLIVFQRSGTLYTAPLDNPTALTEIGPANNPAFGSSYPCGAFSPSGEYLIGIGSGSTVGAVDLTTGEVTTKCTLIDSRDGAPLQAGPGDWFFDPAGNWYLMARDTRGATFGVSTGTVLWQIDPSTCEVTRLGNTDAPTSGTGASWLSAGQYLLSAGNSVYTYFPNNDIAPGTTTAWQTNIPDAPHTINDLGNQWIIPDPIPIFGWTDKGCPDPNNCESCLFTLVQDESTFEINCQPFSVTLPGRIGVCEAEPNPFVTDPFSPTDSGGEAKNPDQNWQAGCSDAGLTLWRISCDPSGAEFTEYLYGTLEEPVTVAPSGFTYLACEDAPQTECETTQWCNEDNNPGTSVYRKECLDGTIIWFDETGEITEPTNKTPGACTDLDPLLPVTEQIICYNDTTYVRVVKEQYTEDPATGLPELSSFQIIWYNEDGVFYDSGSLNPGDSYTEPGDFYLGECNVTFKEIRFEKLCEVDARFILLVDSGGSFARYSLNDGSITPVSIPVPSAGSGADIDNFLLYAITSVQELLTIDVNTNTIVSTVPLFTNDGSPIAFSAASFDNFAGRMLAWDYGTDSVYEINTATAEVSYYSGPFTGIVGTGSSFAVNPVDGKFYVSGTNDIYEIDNAPGATGAATVALAGYTPRANGMTFDRDGFLYTSAGPETAQHNLATGTSMLIIDDWTPGANSLAYYEVVAPIPSCFFRKFGIPEDPNENPVYLSDHNVADFSERVIVGDVDCCECSCGGGADGSGGATIVTNLPSAYSITKVEICTGSAQAWQVSTIDGDGNVVVTYEDETGTISEPATWTVGACDIDIAAVCFDDGTKGYASIARSSDGTITILKQYEDDMVTEINPFRTIESCC